MTSGAFTAVSLTKNSGVTAGGTSIPVGILTGENVEAGDFIFARALENASMSAAIPVQIVNAGKL